MSERLAILDDSSDSEVELKINEQYANRYNVWRNKEELQKYKDLKKEDEDDTESSSESEEETPEFDEEFLRALSLLKGKDPRLYDKNYELFSNREVTRKKTAKEKPMFMKDYERNLIVERGGKLSDDEDEPTSSKVPTYDEEQESLKRSLKEALEDSDGGVDNDNDLLQVRTKTEMEEDEEEAGYLKWLKGEEKEVSEDVKKDMSYLRNYWNDPKLDEGEKFLKDYILNKRYLEKDDSEIPTYEEITSGQLSEDEKMVEEQEKFEHKYNFRFEEPDEEFIKRYPRTVGDSLRKEDTRRKQKRDEKAERIRREREQRKEELKRLKALKRKEIEEKFSKLKEVSGQEDLNLNESDMETDFDPDKHDQKMREMFNDDYYNVEEEQKPEFTYDEELDAENWNNWTGKKFVSEDNEDEAHEEMDSIENDNVEVEEEQKSKSNTKDDFEKEMIEATLPKKKAKKKSLFAKVLSQSKPIYDPDGKSFDEYLDEYYKLDYEDVIGDLPVRYKYRKVIPNDFGLTVNEILTADDRELNQWCSVKKTCQYRNDDEEIYDVQAYKKKSQNIFAKKKLLSSLFASEEQTNEINDATEQHKNKIYQSAGSGSSNSQVETANGDASNFNDDNSDQETELNTFVKNNQNVKKPEKKKCKSKLNSSHLNLETDNRSLLDSSECVECADDDFSKQHNKSKKNKRNRTDVTNQEEPDSFQLVENEHEIASQPKSKKKKRKNKNAANQNTDQEDESDSKSPQSKKRKQEITENELSDCVDSNNDESNANNLQHNSSSIESTTQHKRSSQETAPKKKKKKKRKKKSVSEKSGSNRTQQNQTKLQKFKSNKNKGNLPNDKRLGLSDERLAAYGINPKKFKNKIVYSKK